MNLKNEYEKISIVLKMIYIDFINKYTIYFEKLYDIVIILKIIHDKNESFKSIYIFVDN